MIILHYICTSCSKGAVPIRVARPIVRMPARNAVITVVVQVTKNPRRSNAGRCRIAIEASSFHRITLILFHL